MGKRNTVPIYGITIKQQAQQQVTKANASMIAIIAIAITI
jgi:hypothetical protein